MDKIADIVTRGIVNVIPNKDKLEKLLRLDKKLNIYLGIDPTATRIHVGHAVTLRKLQAFSELGHNVTFLIGDFTALIGDTSDKDTERPVLTYEQIEENFKTYKKQAEKVLDFSKIKVVHNSTWLKPLKFEDIIKLCQNFSVGDFVGRELIKKRLEEGKKVGLHETLYPVMQGYDSFHLDTDVQIGGADQTFNMQAGRHLLKNMVNKESFVLVTDYLIGTDGRKMSKSWGNAIWLSDEPNDMFGKVMSLPDELIIQYFTLATTTPLDKINSYQTQLENGENPKNIKIDLANTLVRELHSESAANEANDYFDKTFKQKSPEFEDTMMLSKDCTLVNAVTEVLGSKSEAKRIISSGGVDLNGQREEDFKTILNNGDEVQIGKKIFKKIKINE